MPKYELVEDGVVYDTVECLSLEGALELAADPNDNHNYGDDEQFQTFFVKRYAYNVDDPDDRGSVKVKVDPIPPNCVPGKKHKWKSPWAFVGGDRDNPGVFSSGGGVIFHELCIRCGCGKTTDTWGTDYMDGTQGHEVITYKKGAYNLDDEET